MSLSDFVASEEPIVRPVEVTLTGSLALPSSKIGHVKKAVILPDAQIGFTRDFSNGALDPSHDRNAMDVALQITDHVEPDEIVVLGDWFDLPDWSLKYVRSADMYWTTQPALVEGAWWLSQLRALVPAARIRYIEGNHEQRMQRAIDERFNVVYDLRPVNDLNGDPVLSIPRLLGLDGLQIEYVGPYPHGEVWLNDDLRLIHGETVRARSGGTVRSVVDQNWHHEGQGHIHRTEMASRTIWTRDGGHTYYAFSPGCLCRIGPNIVPAWGSRHNWSQAIAVVEYTGTMSHVDLVPIQDGRALYDDHEWVAMDEDSLVSRIEADMHWKLH